jgi:3-methyladenine DNA glycosylase AlkD
MTKNEVMALLEANQNERGIKNWKKMGFEASGLSSFGIGLTQLRKLAKQIGRNHELAGELWKTDNYDARNIALLIDEPKKITREQAEQQVEQLEAGMLVHVFASCDATLAKADFAVDLAPDWIDSDDDVRRRCGYLLLYELSKDKKKTAPDDDFFLGYIDRIEKEIHDQGYRVASCMQGALIGIGKRNRALNDAAIRAVKAIGPVARDPEDHCEPTDVLKHLTSDYLKRKFAAS